MNFMTAYKKFDMHLNQAAHLTEATDFMKRFDNGDVDADDSYIAGKIQCLLTALDNLDKASKLVPLIKKKKDCPADFDLNTDYLAIQTEYTKQRLREVIAEKDRLFSVNYDPFYWDHYQSYKK